MINTSLYAEIEKDKKKLAPQNISPFATVIEVKDEGVKIKIDGEEEAREVYYNSYVKVNSGDRVGIKSVSGTLIIEGKLQY
nr:MAG TPA: hypothetical protein [Caudoviricetes sp.]DAY98482.1 MAG TPA: hypothetical protein [Caudoviricetes sp.]